MKRMRVNSLPRNLAVLDSDKPTIIAKYVEGYSLANVRRIINYRASEANIAKVLRDNGVEIRSSAPVGKRLPKPGRFSAVK